MARLLHPVITEIAGCYYKAIKAKHNQMITPLSNYITFRVVMMKNT